MATQSVENVLKLTPTDELRFKGPFNDVITEEVLISNLSAKRMSFKVKTTAPRCYCVRPNSGVIESNSSVTVSFKLQPLEKDGMSKLPHKFMVQAIFVPTTSDDFSNMWSAAKRTDIMTAKLTSVVELSSRQATRTGQVSDDLADKASTSNNFWVCFMKETELDKLSSALKEGGSTNSKIVAVIGEGDQHHQKLAELSNRVEYYHCLDKALYDITNEMKQAKCFCKVMFDYVKERDVELELEAGEIIRVISKDIDNAGRWWEGEKRDKSGKLVKGLFPNFTVAEMSSIEVAEYKAKLKE